MNPVKINDLPSTPPGAEEVLAFPLSPAQERIWRLCADPSAQTIYNGAFRMNLSGRVDPGVLWKTLNEIAARHEILRATIEIIEGEPAQVIAPSLKLGLTFRDLTEFPCEGRESQLDELCAEEAQKPFELSRGPLIRASLVRMDDDRFVFLLTVHQVICDGWSIGLIMDEIQQIYSALAAGGRPSLPPLSLQFPDYVIWQKECASRPEITQQLGYWKKKLRRYRRLALKPDIPSADRSDPAAKIISQLLPKELSDRLRDYSNLQNGTFFITTLAACLTLLHRYTGEDDLAIGSPLAGRTRTELEGLIGQFVNHVVFRADASEDPTFAEFLTRVRDTVWEAFANQDIPFENVLKSLRTGDDPFRDPFYVINFICQREYGRAATFNFDFAGVRMSTMPSKTQGALYDLNFFLVEREVGWRLSLEFKTALFREETAQQLLQHFREVLEQIAQNPERRLSEFSFSDPAPAGKAHAAVSGKSDELYAMPASLAQERFWYLSQLDRDSAAFQMPAAVRITGPLSHEILEKSFLRVMQRHETLRTTFEEVDDELAQVVSSTTSFTLGNLDLSAVPEQEREEKLQKLVREQAAQPLPLETALFRACLFRVAPEEHLLLTVAHHSLADGWSHKILQDDLWTAYSALAEGREPAFPPLTIQFGDFTSWQRDWAESPEADEQLEFWLKKLEGELPVLNFPTDRPPTGHPPAHGAIETLLLPPDLTRDLRSLGQSENVTIFMVLLASFGILLSRYSSQTDLLIGSPVANRRPETEHVIGPFAGPLCLRLSLDGNPTLKELLARVRELVLDALSHAEMPFEMLLERIKMRTVNGRKPLFQFYFYYQTAFLQPRHVDSLRVEPVPTFSLGIPFELQLALIERQEGLRAQLEYNPDLFDAATIRHILADYREILETIISRPLLLLNDVAIASPDRMRTAVAPSAQEAEVEHRLTTIWERVLSVRRIARDENYFDLGGNSVLAARLFQDIENEFGVRLPLSTLLRFQTVRDMASHLGSQHPPSAWSSLVEIRPGGSRPPFFCIHGGGGNVLIYRDLARHLDPDLPVFGFQSQGLDGQQPYLTTVEEMAARYIRELKAYRPSGPYYLGGYCLGGTVALEMARQLTEAGERVAMVALFDTQNWARLRQRTFFDRMQYQLERIAFHVGNFVILDGPGKVRFFKDKVEVLRNRLTVWRGMLAGRVSPGGNGAHAQTESSILARLWETNDRAALSYIPRPYHMPIVDFRPRRQYTIYRELGVNWDGIAMGGLAVVELPVYPAGMLLEPFVSGLAKALQEAVDAHSGVASQPGA